MLYKYILFPELLLITCPMWLELDYSCSVVVCTEVASGSWWGAVYHWHGYWGMHSLSTHSRFKRDSVVFFEIFIYPDLIGYGMLQFQAHYKLEYCCKKLQNFKNNASAIAYLTYFIQFLSCPSRRIGSGQVTISVKTNKNYIITQFKTVNTCRASTPWILPFTLKTECSGNLTLHNPKPHFWEQTQWF